jgi:hypothetical protein
LRYSPLAQLEANGVQHMIGQDSDEQVSVHPSFLLMINGMQPQLRLHAPEGLFNVGEHAEDVEQRLLVEIQTVGTKAVKTAAFILLPPPPGDLCRQVCFFIPGDLNLKTPGHPLEPLLETADLFHHLLIALGPMLLAQGRLCLGKLLLESFLEAVPDTLLFNRLGAGMTVELDLPGIRIIDQRRPDQPAFVLPDRDHIQG